MFWGVTPVDAYGRSLLVHVVHVRLIVTLTVV